MENDRVLLCEIESIIRQTVMDRIFAQCREVSRILPLALDAQYHHDIGALDGVLDLRDDFQFWILDFGFWIVRFALIDQMPEVRRHEGSRSGDTDRCPQLCQQMNV